MISILLSFFALFDLVNLAPAHAYIGDALFLPPHADYQTLTSEHFKVVYPKAYATEAEQAAGFLEEAQLCAPYCTTADWNAPSQSQPHY